MNLVLVDTSVWIEFFAKRPRISNDSVLSLKELISNGDVVLIEPIRAELLSGHVVPKLKNEIVSYFDALDMIDLDWNSRKTWDDIIALAEIAKINGLPIPGLIDRMILIAALNASAKIASLDKGLLTLADKIKIESWTSADLTAR